MTSINFQVDDLNCPYCNSDDVEYNESEYYPDHVLETWNCEHCDKEFQVKTRTEIIEIIKEDLNR